jgi:uncharacterized RDD family membrane protein YckC
MKCPKCGYLGFERVDRCRNCGYEFLLASGRTSQAEPELPLREDVRSIDPLNDVAMVDEAMASKAQVVARDAALDELPLFGTSGTKPAGDQPLITRPSPPRQPLAVRRATPEIPRLRSQPIRASMFDLADDEPPIVARRSASSERVTTPAVKPLASTADEPAGLGSRVGAAAIDLILLAAIDITVIYLTMKICGLTFEDLQILPKTPLIAFLLLQNGGYLVSFTAGGQTLGKMAAGIRVVSARADRSLDFGHSLLRTVVWLVLAVPAGLGLLTTLLSQDRRGLHDRCAGTKVVRASA